MPRRTIPINIRKLVLHEAGYKCSNPICRTIITIELHHLVSVTDNGLNSPDNLLVLCPNCHTLHHQGNIPQESLKAWKMLLISLNKSLDKHALDILLTLTKIPRLMLSGDGVLSCSSLIAADLISIETEEKIDANEKALVDEGESLDNRRREFNRNEIEERYWISLSKKGEAVVKAWKKGDQEGVVNPEIIDNENKES